MLASVERYLHATPLIGPSAHRPIGPFWDIFRLQCLNLWLIIELANAEGRYESQQLDRRVILSTF